MKHLPYLSFLVMFMSCHSPSPEGDKGTVAATRDTVVQTKKADLSAHHTRQDTVWIMMEGGDTFSYAKADFNHIVDEHPEFFEEYPDNPDVAYNYSTDGQFLSEAGQDDYYTLYAYFLKQKNGLEPVAVKRQKLIDIYRHINALFAQLQHGGTFFGHQYRRILGYAEYAVYLQPKDKSGISKYYDIAKQKKLYIQSLRQLIADESGVDLETLGAEKKERNRELNQIVDELDGLITELFYLRRAQGFHYGYYEYY